MRILICTFLLLSATSTASADFVYATANPGLLTDGYPLLFLNSMSAEEVIQRRGFMGRGQVARDLTFSNDALYAVGEVGLSFDYRLKTVDIATGTSTDVGSLGLSAAGTDTPQGIATDLSGTLYTWTSGGALYTINPISGMAQFHSTLPTPAIADIEFYAPNRYYGLIAGPTNFLIDVNLAESSFVLKEMTGLPTATTARRIELDGDGVLYLANGPLLFGFDTFYKLDPITGIATIHDSQIDGIIGLSTFTIAVPEPGGSGLVLLTFVLALKRRTRTEAPCHRNPRRLAV